RALTTLVKEQAKVFPSSGDIFLDSLRAMEACGDLDVIALYGVQQAHEFIEKSGPIRWTKVMSCFGLLSWTVTDRLKPIATLEELMAESRRTEQFKGLILIPPWEERPSLWVGNKSGGAGDATWEESRTGKKRIYARGRPHGP